MHLTVGWWRWDLVDSQRGGRVRGAVRLDRRQLGLPLRTELRVAQEHLPPLGRLAPALEHAAIDERPAVEVVVDVAREDEAVDERRVEEQLLEPLQRTEPDQIAAADPDEILSDVELPVLARGV